MLISLYHIESADQQCLIDGPSLYRSNVIKVHYPVTHSVIHGSRLEQNISWGDGGVWYRRRVEEIVGYGLSPSADHTNAMKYMSITITIRIGLNLISIKGI